MPPPVDPFATAARVRALVEQLPVAVYVDDDERNPSTVYMSPAIEKILGYPVERVIADPELWWATTHPADRDRVQREHDEAWQAGHPFVAEYRMLRADSSEIWVRDSSVLVRGPDGERLAWQGVVEDITTERRAAAEVQESAARYQALVERIPAVVYEMGPDDERRTLYVSPHVEEVLGYTRHEWLDQPDIWIELLHADDREIVLDRHDRHSRTGEPWDLEYRLIANDGRVVWVHDRGTLIRGLEGGPGTWHGVIIDVTAEHEAREMLLLTNEDLERTVEERTAEIEEANELMSLEIGERRRMEAELLQARERYRQLIENLPGVAYLWEPKPGVTSRRFSYLSPQIEQLVGSPAAEWQPEDRVHPHDRDRVAEAVGRSSRTGEPLRIEYRFLAKDGSVVWVLDHASLVSRSNEGQPALFQGVMLDITLRKRAESDASLAEDRFRALTERGPVVVASVELRYAEPETRPPVASLTYISPQVADLIGKPVADLGDDISTWVEMVHPDDRARTAEAADRSFSTGADWNLRYRMIRSDGGVIWIQSFARLLERDERGRPWRFQAVLYEVTEEQREILRLERAVDQQRAAMQGAGAVAWTQTVDPDTRFERYTFIGPQVRELLGYTPEELIEERGHFERMVHPEDRPRIRRSVRRAERSGIWEDEYRVARRDGGYRWLRSFGRRVTPAGVAPEVWHGIAVDVTAARPSEPAEAPVAGERSERSERRP
jgi:PAS domain S-box-containing protein